MMHIHRTYGLMAVLSGFVLLSGFASTVVAQTATTPGTNPSQNQRISQAPVNTDQSSLSKQADQWYNKGILFTVYGNDRAAIDAFKKVISAAPNRSDAHFQLGVSYGEIGDFQSALRAVNQAISLNPDKGVYYYGRARIYLLSGETAAAMDDFNKAAAMGHSDAIAYLNRSGQGF